MWEEGCGERRRPSEGRGIGSNEEMERKQREGRKGQRKEGLRGKKLGM